MNSFGDTTPIAAHAVLRLLLKAGTLDRYTLIETMEALYGTTLDYEAMIDEYEELAEEVEDDTSYEDEYEYEDVEDDDGLLEDLLDEITDRWPDPASLPVQVKARLINSTSPAAESFRLYLLGHEITTRGYPGQHA